MISDPCDSFDALSRRSFIVGAGALCAALAKPSWAQEAPERTDDFWKRPRTIRMRHTSGDAIEATYWSDGELIRSGYEQLCWFMRDRVVNEAVYIHPTVLDITYGVYGWLTYFGLKSPIVLTSGHRNRLRNMHIEGAVRNSLHISGEALDIQIPGVSTAQVARFGAWLGGGGVGWYPVKNFIHLDRGRLRFWKG